MLPHQFSGMVTRMVIKTNIAVFLGFFAMMWIVAMFSMGTFADVLLTLFFSGCCVVALVFPMLHRERKYTSEDQTLSVRALRGAVISHLFLALESRITFIAKCRKWNEKQLGELAPMMGVSLDTEKSATRSTRITFAVIIPCAVSGAYMGITVSEVFFALCAVPCAVFFAPYVGFRLAIMERKTRIEEEMAYFLSYVNIMQTVGTGLYHAFDMLRGEKVFPGMERDASEIIKRVKLIGITQAQSLDTYAHSHPSQPFRDFIHGYLAKISSVGNVPAYTEAKAKYFFDEYIGKWHRYEKSAQEIFSAIIMIAVVMPMIIMLISMIGSPQSAQVMIFLGSAVSPIVAVLMVVMLNSSQPATGTRMTVSLPAVVAGAVVGAAAMVAGIGPATSIVVAVLVGASANHALTRNHLARIRAIDAMMPEFMRDVTEMSKTGSNINQIVVTQAAKKPYKKAFNAVLDDIAAKVRSGMPFDVVSRSLKTESTHVRFIMFILAKTYTTGGGSTDIFNTITEFISKISQTKSEVSKSLKSMSMIVYASPFMMLAIAHLMISMFTDMSSASASVEGGGLGAGLSVNESIIDGIRMMTVLTVVPMGMVAAKITAYTVKDTMPIMIVSLCTLLAIHVIPMVFEVVTF